MKHLYLLTILITSFGFAQIPANYYDSANNLTGYTLKTELKNIVSNGHIARTYDQLYDGDGISGSNGYEDTHSDVFVSSGNNYENDGTILDFYSENPNGTDSYNYTHGNNQCGNQSSEGDCYNREHLVPQSSFNSNFPMQSDIHHVIPTDGRVNNFRGSLPFGNVSSPNFTSLNGSMRGSSAVPGYSGNVFEPIDEFKGDIARALLYFAVRYEDTVDGYTSFDMFNGTNDEVFFPWAIEVLLDWHNNVDPVDQRERDRNQEAYKFQGNANPFVDHPEYASLIWNPVIDTENPSAPTNLVANNATVSSIDLSWNAATDNIAVTAYDIYIDGNFSETTTNTSITINGLAPNTEFCFTVFAKDDALNISTSSNQVCEFTLEGTSTPNELFISEYVEGSSNNKAIEIANYTGATVNLNGYSIQRNSNSGNSWSGEVQLSGNLANGDVYVIARGNANSDILNVTDLTAGSSSALAFNGDDPVGLFKNGTLIDVFGYFNGSNDFENVTYRRKAHVTGPTTAFDLNGEWDMFSNNNVDDLGIHTQTLSTSEADNTNFVLYPNPTKNSFTIQSNISNNFDIIIYNSIGNIVFKDNLNTSNPINIKHLKTGLYFVKINYGNATITKKIIKE